MGVDPFVERFLRVFRIGQECVFTTFSVVVAGTRTFDDYELLKGKLDVLIGEKAKEHKIEIVSGGATGADALGEKYAEERGFAVKKFPANWGKHGKAAGPIRNKEMAEYAHAVVVFWDGLSRGSMSMTNEARAAGKPTRVIRYQ